MKIVSSFETPSPIADKRRSGPPTSRQRAWTNITTALCVLFTLGYTSVPAHAAGDVFARQGTTLFPTSSGGASIGTIMPGTRLKTETSQPSGSRLEVVVTGWFAESEVTALYKAPDLRIVMLKTEAGAAGQFNVLGKKTDSYGTTWKHVAVTGWVPATQVTRNVQKIWAAATKIYDARCSSCHALHAPDQYTANQWPGVLRTMAKNAELNPSERELVTQYLQTHARKP